jgi:hypothetical protein
MATAAVQRRTSKGRDPLPFYRVSEPATLAGSVCQMRELGL